MVRFRAIKTCIYHPFGGFMRGVFFIVCFSSLHFGASGSLYFMIAAFSGYFHLYLSMVSTVAVHICAYINGKLIHFQGRQLCQNVDPF